MHQKNEEKNKQSENTAPTTVLLGKVTLQASTLLGTPVLLLIAVIQIIESAFRCISKHLTEKSINTVSKYL